MNPDYHIVIPARMASQRLPGKPLIAIGGRSLIEHVYRRACEASAKSVVIATDSREIHDAATGFGGEAVMTSPHHESGSDRIAECVGIKDWPDDTLVVNLQGDEPLIPPACLGQVARILHESPGGDAASLFWPIETQEQVEDSNVVKVVVGESGRALYFSRSVIPYPRHATVGAALQSGVRWKRHIGLYAYRAGALKAFSAMQPTPLEQLEKLEQLRFLETGRCIVMERACEYIPAGVDTSEDLERVRELIAAAH
jgi:3-deoxy-manno-octulosonate cytidylyltransferase (CMP-KDO synthetase)